jgi:hypothetical protein
MARNAVLVFITWLARKDRLDFTLRLARNQVLVFTSAMARRGTMDYGLIWPLNVTGTNGSHRVSITASF